MVSINAIQLMLSINAIDLWMPSITINAIH
jgi:hypothetical protein